MTMGTRLHRWVAVLPGVVLSATLLLVVSAMLPAMLGGLLLLCYPTLAVVLALGKWERLAVKVLGRARRATPGEQELLAGLAGRLGDGGWGRARASCRAR